MKGRPCSRVEASVRFTMLGGLLAGVLTACSSEGGESGDGGGTKAPGESCSLASDCASASEGEATCMPNRASDEPPFVCVVEIDGKEGDSPCVGTATEFLTSYQSGEVRGYVCDARKGVVCSTSSKRCEAIKAEGEACDPDEHLPCGPNAGCTGSVCVARLPDGSPCDFYTECASLWCADGTCSRAP